MSIVLSTRHVPRGIEISNALEELVAFIEPVYNPTGPKWSVDLRGPLKERFKDLDNRMFHSYKAVEYFVYALYYEHHFAMIGGTHG